MTALTVAAVVCLAVAAWLTARLVRTTRTDHARDRAIVPLKAQRRYDLTAAPPTPTARPNGYALTSQQARHEPTLASNVGVPAAAALVTAVAVSAVAAVFVWALGWSARPIAAVFAVTLLGAWLWRLGFADRVLWSVESWTGHDIDGDGSTGQPRGYPLINPARAAAAVTKTIDRTDTDARQITLQAFADRCYLVGTSEAAHGITASGPDRAEYTACRDALLRLGLAKWKNPNRAKSGWLLTTDPATCREIIAGHVA